MDANSPRFDDPDLTLDWLVGDHRHRLLRKGDQDPETDPTVWPEDGDSGGRLRRETQDVAEIQIQGDQAAPLQPTNLIDHFIGTALQLFITDSLDVVARIEEDLAGPNPEVLVKLDVHEAGPTGIST